MTLLVFGDYATVGKKDIEVYGNVLYMQNEHKEAASEHCLRDDLSSSPRLLILMAIMAEGNDVSGYPCAGLSNGVQGQRE